MKNDISMILKTKCYIMTVRFWGIQSKTTHGIKYSSKLISVVNPIIENGRIHAAKIIEVILTASDYARYKKLYTWDDMEIIELQIKLRGKKYQQQKIWHNAQFIYVETVHNS